MTEIPQFYRRKEYVDPSGVQWRRRGDSALRGSALGKRLRDADLRVLHHYLGEFTEVPADGRDEFWASASRRMAESGFSEFVGSEFKDPEGRRLLIVDEHC